MSEQLGTSSERAQLQAVELSDALLEVYSDIDKRDFQLETQQEMAIEALVDNCAAGVSEGYVEMATDSGKSILIALMAEAAVRSNKRTLIVTPSLTIADQLTGIDGETGIGRFTPLVGSGKISRRYGDYRDDPTSGVVVTTYSGLLHEHKRPKPILGDFDVILADECHRSLGPKTAEVATNYMPDAVRYGFSATPDYAANRRSEEVYGKSIFEYSLRDMIESGNAAPVRALLFETGQNLKLYDQRKDFSDRELEPLMHLMTRNADALRLANDLLRQGRQGFIACVPGGGNMHARLMARLISEQTDQDRTLVALDVGSHLSREENASRITAYERGECDVLTFTKSLQEGWHSKRTSFGINMAPTASPLKLRQLLGRAMNRNLETIFIDFVDQTSGVSKQQYTALHALEIDHIDVNRVLGGPSPAKMGPIIGIEDIFSSDLYTRLAASQGKLLRDVLISAQGKSRKPIFRNWENILSKAGMPAELPPDGLDPSLLKEYEKAREVLYEDHGDMADHEMTIDYMAAKRIVSSPKLAMLSGFAVRCSLDSALAELETVPAIPDERLSDSDRAELRSRFGKILSHPPFAPLDKQILLWRFGLVSAPGKEVAEFTTLDEIGRATGYTREHIRQREAKALSKLRRPDSRRILEAYTPDDYSTLPLRVLAPPAESHLPTDRLYAHALLTCGVNLPLQTEDIGKIMKRHYSPDLISARNMLWNWLQTSKRQGVFSTSQPPLLIPDLVHKLAKPTKFDGKPLYVRKELAKRYPQVYDHYSEISPTDKTLGLAGADQEVITPMLERNQAWVDRLNALPKPAPRVAHQRAARLLLAETHRDYWQAVRSELINQLVRENERKSLWVRSSHSLL